MITIFSGGVEMTPRPLRHDSARQGRRMIIGLLITTISAIAIVGITATCLIMANRIAGAQRTKPAPTIQRLIEPHRHMLKTA